MQEAYSNPSEASTDDEYTFCAQKVTAEDVTLAKLWVKHIVSCGIRVVAIDFDRTIVSVHTGGCWRKGSQKLISHVRPCFSALLQVAVQQPKLYVCIVTFSSQPGLIKDVLNGVLKKRYSDRIWIRGMTRSWQCVSAMCSLYGKEEHIAWLVTELSNKRRAHIKAGEILLLDDDEENTKMAIDFGHYAYTVPDNVTMKDMKAYADNIKPRDMTIPLGVTLRQNGVNVITANGTEAIKAPVSHDSSVSTNGVHVTTPDTTAIEERGHNQHAHAANTHGDLTTSTAKKPDTQI